MDHARAYLRTGECELRWVYDIDDARARTAVSTLGTGSVASSFEQILADPRVSIVSVASYDDAHFPQVMASLTAGKHVFVEKPMCRTYKEVAAVSGLWASKGGSLKLASNLVLRRAPVYRWLKQAIDDGELGRVFAIDGDYLYGRLDKLTTGWRRNVEDYSVVFGGGIHLIDLMVWLSGELPTRVAAVGNRICTTGTQFSYLDFAAAQFSAPSGLVGRITSNFGCVHRHQHVVRVFGTQRTFLHDDAGPRIHTTRDPAGRAEPVHLQTLPATKGELIPEFVSAVRNDRDLGAATRAVFDVLSICAASDASLATGRVEEIRYS
jgi:predicted dehydrogenase